MTRSGINIFLLVGFFMGASAIEVHAQDVKASAQSPVEISADETLEWYRNDLLFKARKNVRVIQDTTSLSAELVSAKYREMPEQGMEIYYVEADQDVVIVSKDTTVTGQHGVYDLDRGVAVMTGDNLKFESPDQHVTAKDKFEYWMNDGRIEAHGNARAVQEGDTLRADKIIAYMVTNAAGANVLQKLEAYGNVEIKTPTEVITGDEAVYNDDTKIAEMLGNVYVTRGPNNLQGTKARVNLKTNISQLYGAAATGSSGETTGENGRVRGVFYPGSEKQE